MSDNAIEILLHQSRAGNEDQGVTGMLLYICQDVEKRQVGRFIQVLEGKQRNVRKVFKKITKDVRHYNLEILNEMLIAQRNFKDWSMGFKRIDKNDHSTLSGVFILSNDYFETQQQYACNPSFKFLELFYNLLNKYN